MELRNICLCLAFFMLAVVSQNSEARHSISERSAEDHLLDDLPLNDAANDDDAQNDGGDDGDEGETVTYAITSRPTNYTITIGMAVRLECRISPSDSGAMIQWMKGDLLYFFGTMRTTAPERVNLDPKTSDLIIRDTNHNDTGVYTCTILQTKQVSIAHTLIVQESPRIVNFTASERGPVLEGSNLLLTCNVAGYPPPTIVWSRQLKTGANKNLGERDGEFSSNSVFIKNVTKEKAGKYYCYAFNPIGTSQAVVEVRVKGVPHVQVHKTVKNSAINAETVLECIVHGDRGFHIRWYKDGKLIEDASLSYKLSAQPNEEGEESDLTITPQTDRDFGTYTCTAQNEHGTHQKSIELVQKPVIEDVEVDSAKLSWTVNSHRPLRQMELMLRNEQKNDEWTTINVPVPSTSGNKYEVIYVLEELESGVYDVVIKAKNDNSWSDHTRITTQINKDETQPEYIQHASVFRGVAGKATITRPTSMIATSTILMYLLQRLF